VPGSITWVYYLGLLPGSITWSFLLRSLPDGENYAVHHNAWNAKNMKFPLTQIARKARQWELTASEARSLQRFLARHVQLSPLEGPIRRIAGIDVAFPKRGEQGEPVARAAVVVLSLPGLKCIEAVTAETPIHFPYVPGLLSFRELPPILAALEKLRTEPDVLMCDGQGLAHPRRFGVACHLGLATGRPSIGIAKTRLIGRHPAVADERGAWVSLREGEELLGGVLRSRGGIKPLFISPGHRVDVDSAIALVQQCLKGYRLPEPTRAADALAGGACLPDSLLPH